jgi:hypothetical protein
MHCPLRDPSLQPAWSVCWAYGLSLALFVLALRHLGTARTGAYFSTAPFFGAATAVVLLGEPLTVELMAAASLMAIGVWLHVTEQHEHRHFHPTQAHEHAHGHDERHQHVHNSCDPVGEPHSHWRERSPLEHIHRHVPDAHHQHRH